MPPSLVEWPNGVGQLILSAGLRLETNRFMMGKMGAEARQACQKECGDLASLDTKEELQKVLKEAFKVVGGKWLWVGAKRVKETKGFEWLSGGSLKEGDEAWMSGYPSGGRSGDDCAAMGSGGSTNDAIRDLPCSNKKPLPLCEMPGLEIPVLYVFFFYEKV
jgi:hypothetical protein